MKDANFETLPIIRRADRQSQWNTPLDQRAAIKNKDKFLGCLIGGAAGDALGYAVEFLTEWAITSRYGKAGITEYHLQDGLARISDDTQMTLFTANGLLVSAATGRDILPCIADCYMDWTKTQLGKGMPPHQAWLNNVPAINHSRAPGTTCIQALGHNHLGSIARPINNSKGCGGVMRVAPIGLYLGGKGYTPREVVITGAEAAALTHSHDLGYIPAGMLAYMTDILSHSDVTVAEAVQTALRETTEIFGDAQHISFFADLINKAVELAENREISALDAIRQLGEGWVAEETLAIAIYCSLRYEDSFEEAVIAAVNHRGDSDSTGSVTGNIMGARLGMRAIPERFLTALELKDTILEIADDLFNQKQDRIWEQKYVYHTYPLKNN